MFCTKCGKQISDEAVVCIHCGCAVANANIRRNVPEKVTSQEKYISITEHVCIHE